MKIYDHCIPPQGLNHKPPIEAMKEQQEKETGRFKHQLYKQTELDS